VYRRRLSHNGIRSFPPIPLLCLEDAEKRPVKRYAEVFGEATRAGNKPWLRQTHLLAGSKCGPRA